jgi:NADPH2:quinone reductase
MGSSALGGSYVRSDLRSGTMMATEIELPGIGEPETLRVRKRELPDLVPDQALVKVEVTGISFAEQQMRRGKYYDQPPFPFVPGYDLVGIADGQRVAALTKVGGWADYVVLDRADLVPVPDGLTPEQAETVIVNGVTAYRMLHRSAGLPRSSAQRLHGAGRGASGPGARGDTIVVLGAAGGVGNTLTQLSVNAGIRVIGTTGPKQMDKVRELGAIPVDYHDDVPAKVRERAPQGVQAVFDHVGGPGIVDSWNMLAKGGALISYGTLSTKDMPGNPRVPVLKLIGRLTLWNLLPNGRSASFFNLWAGKKLRPERFRTQLREDLSAVLNLLAQGAIKPEIAARFPLDEAAQALRFAEQGGYTGKVILVP